MRCRTRSRPSKARAQQSSIRPEQHKAFDARHSQVDEIKVLMCQMEQNETLMESAARV